MPNPLRSRARPVSGSLVLIAAVVVAGIGYRAGWFSPSGVTPDQLLSALAPPGGPALGHRRDHAKGICFTGQFEANGAGAALSRAPMFVAGRYPVVGRFSVGTADPNAPDATVLVRGMGLRISTPDGQEWRSGMINPPSFPVSTPQAFHDFLIAAGSKDPGAMPGFAAAHPEIAAFGAWAKTAPWTGSYAEERYNSVNSFIFVDNSGAQHAVRWSLVPHAQAVPVSPDELAKRGPDVLEHEIVERIRSGPLQWTMSVTVAGPDDPTADPSKRWPDTRRAVDVGTLTIEQVQLEPDGPCRDINFDPTVLPSGIQASDDPFLAARASVYAKSFDLRRAEAANYPRTAPGPKQ
jgi:catalase